MNLEPAPRLPKLPFFVADAVILAAAAALATFSSHPLDTTIVVLIAVLVMIGAALIIAPFIAAYIADTAEAVQRERERVNDQVARLHAATESLARAAAQIKAVEEAVHKAARDAETLPYRMQEKLAEFNETLAAKEESDREALETELEELRATQSDQLKHTAEKIAKAAADWAALEAATRKQFAAAEVTLAKLQNGSSDVAAQFHSKVSTAIKELDARIVDLQHAAASVPTTITVAAMPAPVAGSVDAPAPAKTPHEVPAKPASAAVAQVSDRRNETASAPDAGHRPALLAEPLAATPLAHAEAAPAPAAEREPAPASAATAETPTAAPAVEPVHSDAPLAPAPAAEPASASAAATAPAALDSPKPKKPRAPRKPKAEETLLAMSTEEPAASASGAEHAPAAAPAPAELDRTPERAPVPAPEPEPTAAPEPVASVASDEPAPESASSAEVESSTSSDGATRLLATAYIGIGNKLFIRGDGPGLTWDHGVPMQFVSIGKWGWSTHDASGPVRCKLYKNDDLASLAGEITLEAGRHTEVTALF